MNDLNNINDNSNGVNEVQNDTNKNVDVDSTENSKDDNKSKKSIFDEFCDMVESVLFSIFTVILIFTFLFKVASVIGSSMEPTLHGGAEGSSEGDKLIVSSAFYHEPKQGDIIIIDNQSAHLLEDTDNDGQVDDVVEVNGLQKTIVKRVIAVAGQTLDIDFNTGNVYVNGEVINEPYINNLTTQNHGSFEYPITVPEGYVFVMGDNREVSKDSRSDEIGLVPVEDIIGKVVLRISPLEKFGTVD